MNHHFILCYVGLYYDLSNLICMQFYTLTCLHLLYTLEFGLKYPDVKYVVIKINVICTLYVHRLTVTYNTQLEMCVHGTLSVHRLTVNT